MDVVLIVATIVGGLAAVGYFLEKARAIPWNRVRFRRQPAAHGGGAAERPKSWADLPPQLSDVVRGRFPRDRLPTVKDLQGDWAEYYDPTTHFPIACKGNFLGTGRECWATFLMGLEEPRYRVVVALDDRVVELTAGNGRPQNIFVRRVPPGTYRPSESTHVTGEAVIQRLRLVADGINLGTFESADSIFYWNPRRDCFEQVWMSD